MPIYLFSCSFLGSLKSSTGWISRQCVRTTQEAVTTCLPPLVVSTLNVFGGPLICAQIITEKMVRAWSKPFLNCQSFVGIAVVAFTIILLPFSEFKVRRMFEARQHLLSHHEVNSYEDEQRIKRCETLLEIPSEFLIRSLYPVKAQPKYFFNSIIFA